MNRPLLKFIGIIILLAGLGCAAIIERNARALRDAAGMENQGDDPLSLDDSRRISGSAKNMTGNVGLLFDGWLQSGGDLGHSRPFAIVVAVGSLIAAVVVFRAAAQKPPK